MGSVYSWFKKNFINTILVLIFLVGVGLLAYPTVSDWYNSFHQSFAIMNYSEKLSQIDRATIDAAWASAQSYNERLRRNGNNWSPSQQWIEEYMKELNIDDTGIMGYIQIPKIDVRIPLYHTTEERVLQKGIGHLPGTSLPVGGEGTHCVVSGHRGLPTARLFTDLDKMVVGDKFQLNILDKTLFYEVDQIRIVEPEDFSQLQIDPEKDYCTLFTCTPYGINTHRLLVRGHRIRSQNGSVDVPSDALQYEPVLIAPFFASPILLIGLAWMIITTSSRRKLRKLHEKALSEVLERTGTAATRQAAGSSLKELLDGTESTDDSQDDV